jgi:uncharacterized membrane protein YeiH
MIVRRGEPLLPLAAMRLQGLHNAANAMAALAMAEALELPLAPALEALCAFAGGWVVVGAESVGLSPSAGLVAGAVAATLLRAMAIVFDWRLPAWRASGKGKI